MRRHERPGSTERTPRHAPRVLWASARGFVGLALGLGLFAGPIATATGQTDAAPLAGPTVEVRELPGVREEYVESAAGRTFAPERAVPLTAFLQSLREVGGPEAADELRLSAEQRAAVIEEIRLFRGELVAFLAEHGDELRELINALPQSERGRVSGELRNVGRIVEMLDRVERSGGVFGDSRRERARRGERSREPLDTQSRDDEFRIRYRVRNDTATDDVASDERAMTEGTMMMLEDGTPDIRGRVLALRAEAPAVAALQTRVWEILSPAQRSAFGDVLDKYLAESRARAEAQRLRRDIERRQAAAAERQAGKDQPGGSDRPTDAKGVAERLAAASDEQVRRLLRTLEMGEIPQTVWERLPARLQQRLSQLSERERAEALARWVRELRGASDDG